MDQEKPNKPTLVRDLMSVGVYTCTPETTMEVVARALLDMDLDAGVVLDYNGHAIGVASRNNLVRAFARGLLSSAPIEQVMDSEIPTIPPDIPLTAAAQLMLDRNIRTFYLTHHAGGIEYPAALISYRHLLRLIAARDRDDLTDLGIKAEREPPLKAFFERRDAARQRNLSRNLNDEE